MITTASFIRSSMNIVLPAVVAVCCICCDYRGTLVDPDDQTEPLFTLQGNISAEIPGDYFKPSKSVRIGLMPRSGYYNSDAMSDPETYRKYYKNTGYSDTFSFEYPAISFTGEFPMNFLSEFRSLPTDKMIDRYRGPSGTTYRLGIYAIGLFDDIDNDGKIRMSLSPDESGGVAMYSPGSDRIIGICGDYFIIYLEDAALLGELNPYIVEHIGAHAVWQDLHAGFNLVSLTSEVRFDSLHFTGVRAYPPVTALRIDRFDLTDTADGNKAPGFPSMLASWCLFHFQRNYQSVDFTFIPARAASDIDTLFLKTWGPHRAVRISGDGAAPSGDIISVAVSAQGVFDGGYYDCSNPMMGNGESIYGGHFTVNGQTCAHRVGDEPDTLAVEGDTLAIGTALCGIGDCGEPLTPIYVDTLVISVQKPAGARYTIVPAE